MKSLFTVCLLTTLLSGCATLDEKKKEQYFNDTVRVYEQAIRWADFATATSFQRLEQTATPQAMQPDSIPASRTSWNGLVRFPALMMTFVLHSAKVMRGRCFLSRATGLVLVATHYRALRVGK